MRYLSNVTTPYARAGEWFEADELDPAQEDALAHGYIVAEDDLPDDVVEAGKEAEKQDDEAETKTTTKTTAKKETKSKTQPDGSTETAKNV